VPKPAWKRFSHWQIIDLKVLAEKCEKTKKDVSAISKKLLTVENIVIQY
jgi:hypothetical protein